MLPLARRSLASCRDEGARASPRRLRDYGGDDASGNCDRDRSAATADLECDGLARPTAAEREPEGVDSVVRARSLCRGRVSTAPTRRDVPSREPRAVCLATASWRDPETLSRREERGRHLTAHSWIECGALTTRAEPSAFEQLTTSR